MSPHTNTKETVNFNNRQRPKTDHVAKEHGQHKNNEMQSTIVPTLCLPLFCSTTTTIDYLELSSATVVVASKSRTV